MKRFLIALLLVPTVQIYQPYTPPASKPMHLEAKALQGFPLAYTRPQFPNYSQNAQTNSTASDAAAQAAYAAQVAAQQAADQAAADQAAQQQAAYAQQQAMSQNVPYILQRIRSCESGGNYQAQNPTSTASGAYQFLDSTWAGYGGYSRAMYAPAGVQDQYALEEYNADGTRPWLASSACWG